MITLIMACIVWITIHRQHIASIAEPIVGPGLRLTRPNEFSFIVGIKVRKANTREYSFCTGSIISKSHVLTAAHCFNGDEIVAVEVLAGSPNLNTCNAYQVEKWMTYNDWAKKHNKHMVEETAEMNDIAVLALVKSIYLSGKLKKAIFSKKKTEDLYGLDAQMVGWGSELTHSESDLHTAKVTILTREGCFEFNRLLKKQDEYVPTNVLCTIAEPYVVGRKGDSGAPLVYKDKKILGILKGVSPNQQASSEGMNIFISVDPYKDFINSILNG